MANTWSDWVSENGERVEEVQGGKTLPGEKVNFAEYTRKQGPLLYRFPCPPSLNNAYGNKRAGGRVLKKKGRNYKNDVGATARREVPGLSFDDVRVQAVIVFHFPTDHRRDIANFEKLPMDAVSDALGFDDKIIDDSQLLRGPKRPDDPHMRMALFGYTPKELDGIVTRKIDRVFG